MSAGSPTSSNDGGSQVLLRSLYRLLRPLVRLMLARSIPFQQAIGLLKQVYVDVAAEELVRSGDRPSASRLSLSTGIHRKEIKRLHENPASEDDMPASVALGAQLVARWTNETPFVGKDDEPLALTRSPEEGGAPSFHALVTSVTTDIHPRSVLDEWLRLGIVRVDDDKRIHLLTAAFVPHEGFEEKAFYFGRNLHDHIDVAARNVEGETSPKLERSVHYGDLPRAAVDQLETLARREGMKLLERVNRRARQLRADGETRSEQGDGRSERMNFGLYFYRGPGAADDLAGETDDA